MKRDGPSNIIIDVEDVFDIDVLMDKLNDLGESGQDAISGLELYDVLKAVQA